MPSGSKKQQIRYQQQYQDVVMAEQLDDIVLRRGPASTPALPDRLVLSSLDSRRLRVKAGDWLLISGSQPEKESRVNQENEDCPRRDSGGLRLMLRAWPGSNVPQGTAVGGGPLLSGQFFGKRRQGEDVNVSVRALPAMAKWLAASKVVLRVVPEGDGRESTGGGARETSRRDTPSQSSVAPVLFWKARLHSVLVGQLVFPGLRLAFASLGQGVSFEVVEVRAARGEMAGGAESMPDLATLTLKEVTAPQEPRVGLDLESVCEVLPGTRVAVAGLFPHGKAETATGWRGEPSGAKWGERLVEGGWWASVGGLEAVVEELRQGVEQSLDSLHVFLDRGLRPARGFLLVGPSGTGKTTLLR
ncbi:aaa family cdc48 subfamily [Nannochloropsis gaditana]|uniref:Aaa family cdc48 subfamily n=1 Tax=Nannochloropsis gaditana TaxID=72520 RepID=W7TT23_9STRA|nr:aaa family cdc48 subfamily [Nannochloropsis gaditana]